jgi:hypothetical protein
MSAPTTWVPAQATLEDGEIPNQILRNATMGIKLTYLTPLLSAGAVAVAIIAAPIAAAAPSGPALSQSCEMSGSGTVCESPGNVQINDAPPVTDFYPYGGDAFLLGGYGFGGGYGGFHGGGHGGGGHR